MDKNKKSKKVKRIVSSLVGFPLVVCAFVFSNNLIMDILLSIVSIICIYEYTKCFKTSEKARPSRWLMYIVSLMIIGSSFLSDIALREIMIAILPISFLVLMIEMVFAKDKKSFIDVAISLVGIMYIPMMLVFLSYIRGRFEGGKVLLWYIFIAAWGSDIFAYLIGCRFGKHKFTKISPNKSIEGCVAGILGATVLAIIFTLVINPTFNLSINIGGVAIITAILAFVGQIGDLAASSIKRYCDVKDFSELIPGHGGMLDRIDSVIFILPFAYILLGLLV